jgi:hypothetical protein
LRILRKPNPRFASYTTAKSLAGMVLERRVRFASVTARPRKRISVKALALVMDANNVALFYVFVDLARCAAVIAAKACHAEPGSPS